MSHYTSIKTAWNGSFGLQKPLRHRQNPASAHHEASIDNMANEGSLLSVIRDLLNVLISFNLAELISALATVTAS